MALVLLVSTGSKMRETVATYRPGFADPQDCSSREFRLGSNSGWNQMFAVPDPLNEFVHLTSLFQALTRPGTIYHNVILMIGEFEYLILTSAARLGEAAYGASIRGEIEDATGHHCSIGALYTTLDRLEGKGYLKTWMGDPTPQRGGRSKRLVRVTASGTKAATDFFRAVNRISQGV